MYSTYSRPIHFHAFDVFVVVIVKGPYQPYENDKGKHEEMHVVLGWSERRILHVLHNEFGNN